MAMPAENVVAFYKKRGRCEQWIKGGNGAIRWTRLSCRSFAAIAVRPQLHAPTISAISRILATPEQINDWLADEPQGKAYQDRRLVSHGRYLAFQMAEVAIPRTLFADILARA